MSTPVVNALLEELDGEALDRFAELLAPRLAARGSDTTTLEDGWLDSRHAAQYMGIGLHALHKLAAAKSIPCEQERAGCKLWFKRSELDAWIRSGRPAKRRSPAA
jgi:hypothetical protein